MLIKAILRPNASATLLASKSRPRGRFKSNARMLQSRSVDPPSAFVAYPFNQAGRQAVDLIIRPALAATRHSAITLTRSDDIGFLHHIKKAVSASSLLIGVVIDKNPNVFYEIGLATAHGIPCILVGRSSDELGMLAEYPSVLFDADPDPLLSLIRCIELCRQDIPIGASGR